MNYIYGVIARHLTDAFDKCFSEANLWNIRQFYVAIPEFDQFAKHCVANLIWNCNIL